MKSAIFFALLLTAPLALAQQPTNPAGGGKSTKPGDDNCGILYGKSHSLTFCAPEGWLLDNSIMNDQGIYAVFYPKGSSFKRADQHGTILYINVVLRGPDDTVESLMKGDIQEARQSSASAVVEPADPILVKDRPIPVQRFVPGAFNRYEAVAYILENKTLVMFVISSRSADLLKKDYEPFRKLVQSYVFLTSEVNIEHQEKP